VQLVRLLKENRLGEARGEWQALQPLVEMLFAEPNPGPVKALLAHARARCTTNCARP
jgi:4-hydroxy-tetrahydrodipicolinate synthase